MRDFKEGMTGIPLIVRQASIVGLIAVVALGDLYKEPVAQLALLLILIVLSKVLKMKI